MASQLVLARTGNRFFDLIHGAVFDPPDFEGSGAALGAALGAAVSGAELCRDRRLVDPDLLELALA